MRHNYHRAVKSYRLSGNQPELSCFAETCQAGMFSSTSFAEPSLLSCVLPTSRLRWLACGFSLCRLYRPCRSEACHAFCAALRSQLYFRLRELPFFRTLASDASVYVCGNSSTQLGHLLGQHSDSSTMEWLDQSFASCAGRGRA